MPVADPAVDARPASGELRRAHRLMFDMLLLAFQLTRRVSRPCCWPAKAATALSPRSAFPRHITISTHHRNNSEMIDKVKEIDLWYMKQFAKFIEKMEQTIDVNGRSLLHIR